MSECPVCVEPCNRSTRLPVTCAGCDYAACRACYEKYLLQENEPKCMSCNRVMTRAELVSKFTKKFIQTEYKYHRERLLFDQERAMLPATQVILERMIEESEIRRRITRIRSEIDEQYRLIRLLENELQRGNSAQLEKKTFIRKCPNADCRGFLSTQWKCNLCSRWTCKECISCILTEPHVCDPNQVETAKLLAKDSKPCPNCGEIIFKIDGCDQIFCTQCHTAFSWRTGRRETGAIHNPHYFEWLRRTHQDLDQALQVRCGRELDHYFARQLNRQLKFHRLFLHICHQVIHVREVIVPRYATHPFADNQDLRLQYLQQRLSDEDFQWLLQKREKARERKQEYFRLFAMLIQCATDILYRLAAEKLLPMTEGEQGHMEQAYIDEIANLLAYVNGCLREISTVFNSKCYEFSAEFEFRTASV